MKKGHWLTRKRWISIIVLMLVVAGIWVAVSLLTSPTQVSEYNEIVEKARSAYSRTVDTPG
jgi:ABC-type Na+ efflux pump permease subunit